MSTSLIHQDVPLFDSQFSTSTDTGRSKLFLGLIAALAVLALCLSGYLTWSTWSSGTLAGCTAGGIVDCDEVLASSWSKWMGLPVSLLGALTYVGILIACGLAARTNRGIAWSALLTLSLMAAGAAAWFISLQVVVLQSFCLYCMGVHLCGLSIGVLTLLIIRGWRQESNEDQMRALFGVAAATEPAVDEDSSPPLASFHPLVSMSVAASGLVLLLVGHFFFQPPGLVLEKVAEATTASLDAGVSDEVAEDPQNGDTARGPLRLESETASAELVSATVEPKPSAAKTSRRVRNRGAAPRLMMFGGLKEPIDVANVPILGSPEAEHVIVEMMDYTCPHCRNLHPLVHAALERYGDQLAFIVVHVPLSKKCNPHVRRDSSRNKYACDYARLSMSVWKLDRRKFAEFHNWLMESKRPPSVVAARRHAMKLVGEAVLLDESLKADSLRLFAGNSDEMMKMNTGLPTLVVEEGIIRGYPHSESEWFEFLEEMLKIKPLSGNVKQE